MTSSLAAFIVDCVAFSVIQLIFVQPFGGQLGISWRVMGY